jgi:hypothetical protein
MSYKVVAVKFVSHDEYGRLNNKTYDYLTSDESLQVEDLVVVRTSAGFSVAQIVEFKEYSSYAKSLIVDKVDMTRYNEETAKIKRAQELRAKLEAELAEEQRLAVYREAAKHNTRIQELLEELESLKND